MCEMRPKYRHLPCVFPPALSSFHKRSQSLLMTSKLQLQAPDLQLKCYEEIRDSDIGNDSEKFIYLPLGPTRVRLRSRWGWKPPLDTKEGAPSLTSNRHHSLT